MKAEIKIPAVGESITEATIAQWAKKNGDAVKRDEILLVLETDKASVEVVSEHDGQLTIQVPEGQTVAIGAVVGTIDTEAKGATTSKPSAPPPPPTKAAASTSPKPSAPPSSAKPTMPPPPTKPEAPSVAAFTSSTTPPQSPAVRRIVTEQGLDVEGLQGTGKGGRLTKGDVQAMRPSAPPPVPGPTPQVPSAKAPTPLPQPRVLQAAQTTSREPMTKLRQTIAKRLVEAQHTAAILTTFNEIDMTNVMALRAKYKDRFKEKYGVNLGFMGFFVKATIEALRAFPRVNAFIDGHDVIYNHFYNIGMAVGTDRGLVVPVIRNADLLNLAEVELSIKHYAEKARDGKIAVDDLTGGTFTISNGGVYGSLLSTPILNPPQSGILGLHKIEERPVAIQGKVEIRPMMYVALSYDHRIIDGSESVSFLVKVKEGLEDPARLLLEI